MRLPKWLWNLIRSKRVHRTLVAAPFIALVGVVLFYWGSNRWGQAKLEATMERMRALEIPISPSELEAAHPEGSKSIAEHPTLLAWVDSKSGSATRPQSPVLAGSKLEIYLRGAGAPDFVGDLKALFAASESGTTDEMIATQFLSRFREDFTELNRAFEALEDPEYHLPFLLDLREDQALKLLNKLAFYQTLRACLLAESGKLEDAIQELAPLFQLIGRWQHYPMIFAHYVEHQRFVHALLEPLPIILECARRNPAPLHRLAEMLRSADKTQPLIRSIETDLGIMFLPTATDFESATTLSWEEMSWNLDWRQDWANWKKTSHEWWWQIRPAGFTRADVARIIEIHLDHITRRPDRTLRSELDWGNPKFGEGFANDIPSTRHLSLYSLSGTLDAYFTLLLPIRFARLAVACEQHLHQTGSLPDSAHVLSPEWLAEPLISPYSGKPIRLTRRPDGRLQFAADGRDSSKPILFEYPPKP